MQQHLADETLVAYVDGELDTQGARAVEARLASDPEAAHKVALMRRSAEVLRGAYDEIMSEPIPDRLLAVLGATPRAPVRQGSWLHRVGRAIAGPMGPRGLLLAGAFGAAALLLGFGLGQWQVARDDAYALAGIAPDSGAGFDHALTTIMDAGTEGASAAYDRADIGVTGTVTALAPLDLGPGVTCRRFRDEAANGTVTVTALGIACRGSDGVWVSLVVPDVGTAP